MKTSFFLSSDEDLRWKSKRQGIKYLLVVFDEF